MNTNSGSAPRLACRAARLRAALAGAPGRSAHVAGCADCQRHFAAAAAFDTALRREAARPAADIPARLERGILRAVAESRLDPAQAADKSAGSLRWLAGAALAAAAVVAMVFALRPPAPAPGGALAVRPPPSREAIAPAAPVAQPAPAFALPTADALASQNPLQSELDHVYSDARYALRFLAMNFLPADAVERAAATGAGRGEG